MLDVGRFRPYKRLNYLRCCRAANRSATVAFATVPAAADIAAAMFGSSSVVFAPLNALAFMSRVAARSRVACAVCIIASTATLMPLPLPLLRPATARAVSALIHVNAGVGCEYSFARQQRGESDES